MNLALLLLLMNPMHTICLNLGDRYMFQPCNPSNPSGCVREIQLMQGASVRATLVPVVGGGVQCTQPFQVLGYGDKIIRIEFHWRSSGTNPQNFKAELPQGFPPFTVVQIPPSPVAFGVR